MGEHQKVLGPSAMLGAQSNILKEDNVKKCPYDSKSIFIDMSMESPGTSTQWRL